MKLPSADHEEIMELDVQVGTDHVLKGDGSSLIAIAQLSGENLSLPFRTLSKSEV